MAGASGNSGADPGAGARVYGPDAGTDPGGSWRKPQTSTRDVGRGGAGVPDVGGIGDAGATLGRTVHGGFWSREPHSRCRNQSSCKFGGRPKEETQLVLSNVNVRS